MATLIKSWSGDIRFTPAEIVLPGTEPELQQLVQQAADRRQTLRCVGARHSCSPIFETNQLMVVMENFKGLMSYDQHLGRATMGAANTVEETGELLFNIGFSMENTGHINQQTLAGAVSTGTHGAGKTLRNLSGQMVAVRMVTGTGEIHEYADKTHPDMMKAIGVSLGSLGIFTQVTLRVLPAFQLHRRQYCCSTAHCLENLLQLMDENRNFCFYWYPRRDDVSLRLWNPPGEGTLQLPYAYLYKEYTGWSKDVLPTHHELKYNELEYAFDLHTAPEVFQEIRRRILNRHRKQVAWRVLYRPVAGDEVWLSNAFQRDSVAITVHQHATLPYQEYFNDIEAIFRSYGGRPHWGKKHTLKANDLRQLYPMWDSFHELRRKFDPQGVFLNTHLREIFGEEHTVK